MTDLKNIEIKAKYSKHDRARNLLKEKNAERVGLDEQVDTYFKVDGGRLKIREGKIENSIIYYERPDTASPKDSDVVLSRLDNPGELKRVLKKALEVFAVVDKKREIYWLENVKVHLDEVKNLGQFIEFELVKDKPGKYEDRRDMNSLMEEFGVDKENLIECSYSDMVSESDILP